MKDLFLMIITAVMVTTNVLTTEQESKWLPECPVRDSFAYTVHVPHETDCHKFYKCFRQRGYVIECPTQRNTRLVFNEKESVCDWPENVDCSGRDVDGGTTNTLPAESSTAEVPSVCPPSGGVKKFPHSVYCNYYYLCKDGQQSVCKCLQGHYYNPNIGQCDLARPNNCTATSKDPPSDPSGICTLFPS